MPTVDMHDAETRLRELVQMAEAGEEVVLSRGGKPAVKLTPVSMPRPTGRRKAGLLAHLRDRQPKGWDEKIPPEELFPDLFE